MKKCSFLGTLVLIFAGAALAILPSLATPAVADILLTDIDILPGFPLTDMNSTYWTGSDDNPSDWMELNNANPTTEEAWLEALLGLVYDDPSVSYFDRIEANEGGLGADDKFLTDFDPDFSWEYAVVKYANYWNAYQDIPSDDLLTVASEQEKLSNGISHITFFNGAPSVPEPPIMLLLGSGLIGLAVFSRKLRKK
jgi:hypothetical protein